MSYKPYETKTEKHNNYINVNSNIKCLNLEITSMVLIVGKLKEQNTTLSSLIERKQMSFQKLLEAIRFLLMSECKWQRISCSGTMVGKRTLTIGL